LFIWYKNNTAMAEKILQNAVELTAKFKEQINEVLKQDPRYINNLLEINSHLKRIEGRLVYMGGNLKGQAAVSQKSGRHGPIKNFMGRKILQGTKQLSAEQADEQMAVDAKNKTAIKKTLTTEQQEMELFKTQIQKLREDILKFPPQSILTNYRIAEHERIVRGLAKQMGIVDFKTREYNIAFVTEIQEAVAKANDQEDLAQKADSGAAKDITATGTAAANQTTLDTGMGGDANDDPGMASEEQNKLANARIVNKSNTTGNTTKVIKTDKNKSPDPEKPGF
jgi:hypothetical protein